MKKSHFKNSELFSDIAHEIKNSLNPVINLSSLLLRNTKERLTPDESSYLEVIERNGRKILSIVEDFSFLNRLYEKNRKHTESSADLKDIIDNTLTGIMEFAGNIEFNLTYDIAENSSTIVTEKEVLKGILENICLFFLSTGSDKPSLYFKSFISDTGFNLITSSAKTAIEIKDRKIFDKDTAAEKGFSRSSLMRLQFAAMYTHYLDGEVYFSDDENGSSFSFSIPLSESLAGAVTNKSAAEPLNASGREFILLVIDDDIDNIIPVNAIIEHEFKGRGKVYHAESGSTGLDMLEKIRPDIILLDLTLPDISGLSLVRNIKHLFVQKNVPVIAFSGLDIALDREKMLKAGFDDVIKKPFNIDTFARKIRKWVD